MFEYHKKESPIISLLGMGGGIGGYSNIPIPTGVDGYTIQKSLRFDGNRSTSYLSRSVTGTSTTYTVSMWAKKCANGLNADIYFYPYLFTSADTGAGLSGFGFQPEDKFNIYTNGGHNATTSVYKDPSAWYHIVVSVNSGTATVYINGEQISGYSIADCQLSGTCYIGAIDPPVYGSQYYFDGYIADFYLIDGQALSSTSFGEFDATTRVWNPKRYTGGYGSNGCHLTFNDRSTSLSLGLDSSGNGNNFNVYNITPGPASAADYSDYVTRFDGTSILSEASGSNTGNDMFDGNKDTYAYVGNINDATCYIDWSPSGGFTTPGYIWIQGGDGNGDGLDGMTVTINGATVTYDETVDNETYNQPHYTWGNWWKYTVSGNTINSLRVTGAYALIRGLSTVADPTHATLGISNDNDIPQLLDAAGSDVDSLFDSPVNGTQEDTGLGAEVSGNYCTWNPLSKYQSSTDIKPENGNLEVAPSSAGYAGTISGTIAIPKTGKWYWEVGCNIASFNSILAGVETAPQANYAGTTNGASIPLYYGSSVYYQSPITSSVSPTWAIPSSASDIFGFAVDMDAGKLYLYYNGVIQNGGTAIFNDLDLVTEPLFPSMNSTSGCRSITNFGQRRFDYQAPTGYKALCTANLPEPTIGVGSTAMDVALYAGSGATSNTISGLAFSPDLVWIKMRTNTSGHAWVDTVRGRAKIIDSRSTSVESTSDFDRDLTSFNSDGFTVDDSQQQSINVNGDNFAAWCWDAGSEVRYSPGLSGAILTNSHLAFESGSDLDDYDRAARLPGTGTIYWTSGNNIKPIGNVTNLDLYIYQNASNDNVDFTINGSAVTPSSTIRTPSTAYGIYGYRFAVSATVNAFSITNGSGSARLKRVSADGVDLTESINTNGTIPAAVNANPSAGFSIVSYTGTGSAATVGHGLNDAPQLLAIKNRDSAYNWIVGSTYLTSWDYELKLDTTDAQYQSGSVTFNSTAPTSSVFSLGSTGSVNFNGHNFIAYCWAPVDGYSAFGRYTGNGSATDGPFVYLGFRPRFILIKAATATGFPSYDSWMIFDTARDPYNEYGNQTVSSLWANKPVRENYRGDGTTAGSPGYLQAFSNGFLPGYGAAETNDSGSTYIYAAFAEHPFRVARAR